MTAESLVKAANERRCVVKKPGAPYIAWCSHRLPAAFVVNMQFRIVASALPSLMVYQPKKKAEGKAK